MPLLRTQRIPLESRKARPPRRRAVTLLITLFSMYAAWMGVALVIQGRVIFPGSWMRTIDTPRLPPASVEVYTIPLDRGGVVEAWFVPPATKEDSAPAPLLVLFHGNGELIDDYASEAEFWASRGFGVLLPEFRGYGASAGVAVRATIRADALEFIGRASSDRRIDSERVVYIGRSLGGAVAADLARDRPPAALVLESAFTDIAAMFRRAGLPGFVSRHRYNPREAITEYEGPVLLVHGAEDRVIPVSHGRRLAKARPDAEYLEPTVGHYPSVEWSGYDEAVLSFLRRAGVIGRTSPSESEAE